MITQLSGDYNVVEIKEQLSGLLLSVDSDQDVSIEAFVVLEDYTKKLIIPKMVVADLRQYLNSVSVNNYVSGDALAKKGLTKGFQKIPISKGGNIAFDDDRYLEIHIYNASGDADWAGEIQTYEELGESVPIVWKRVTIDEDVAVKDLDLLGFDFIIGDESPREIQAVKNGNKYRISGTVLDVERLTRDKERAQKVVLDVRNLTEVSLYKETGKEMDFYLLDVI